MCVRLVKIGRDAELTEQYMLTVVCHWSFVVVSYAEKDNWYIIILSVFGVHSFKVVSEALKSYSNVSDKLEINFFK